MALGKYSRLDGRQYTGYCSSITFVVFVGLCLVGVWMLTSSTMVPVKNLDDTSQENKSEMKTQVSETSGNNMDPVKHVDESSQEGKSETQVSETNGNDMVPVKHADGSSQENKSEMKTQVSDTNENNDGNTSKESNSSSESHPKQFQDNPGDLPEDATKGDTQIAKDNQEEDADVSKRNQEENADVSKTNQEENADVSKTNQEENADVSKTNQDEKADVSKTNQEQNADVPKTNQEENAELPKLEHEKNLEKQSEEEKQHQKEDLGFKANDRDSEAGEKKPDGDESNSGVGDSQVGPDRSNFDGGEKKAEEKSSELKDGNKAEGLIEEKKPEETTGDKNELLPSGAQAELLNETMTQDGAWKTQAAESKKEKDNSSQPDQQSKYSWKLCNVTAGTDYIPCLDNLEAIRNLKSTKHYEHRERQCPDEPPTCLVPLPEGYQKSIQWPTSRERIWYHNVPHTKLAEFKGHQNWVKLSGEYLTFPGGGTQFKHGALHYIDFIQQIVPDIAWGKRSRVVLDVGCGVASFGGFLFDRDVLTMSFAPKDEHEAQVQFALERGIPALSAVMGTKRLPFPAIVFDIVHCARCRVPWHIEGGKLLLELNRLLRPGGFFVWSATPVYQKRAEDVEIWEAMKQLTKAMCWEVVSISKDKVNRVGVAVYRKPSSNECYETRPLKNPPLCKESDDPNAAWNVPLQSCMHKVPGGASERGSQWPVQWPERVEKPPYWLLSSQVGVYGKAAPEDFTADYEHWKRVVTKSYLSGMGINWSVVRNVMDMRAVYGGFAAALREMNVWVMNVVNVDSPDTLPIIYERGLFGIYHDWCQSFSTYPRSYDLLHADHLFSKIKAKCNFEALVAEVDRILRPEGKLIVRDKVETIGELETVFMSMHWEVRMTYSKDKEGLLCVQKTMWRPKESITITYAIA